MSTTTDDPTPNRDRRVLPDLAQTAPADEHNERLVDHVHPRDWINPEPAERYDMVVVGGGTAGLVTAAGAAGLGAKVALVERDLLGGDCLNVGCVPSKALLASARAAAGVRDAGAFGVNVAGEVGVDFAAVMRRMRALRASISPHDSARRFTELGVDVFFGAAHFTSRETVQVGDRTLRFRRACIATGARAVAPSVPGIADAGYLTNETVFSLTERPQRLAVIGAGPIGCELAQAFARLGSAVTLLDHGERILGREDPDASACVHAALERDGVEILCGTRAVGAERQRDARVLLLEHADGTRRELRVDAVLAGVGRTPNVPGLGLEQAGVEYDERAGVHVDDRLRTTNACVFAAGDVCAKFRFTHSADAMARIVIGNALFFGRSKTSSLVIPWCTYTDPEVAHVGLDPRSAAERGIAIDTFTVELSEVDRWVLDGSTNGFVRVHTKQGSDRILGATIVARHAGDMISELSLAITSGLGLGAIAKTIHPYPTQAEAIKKAADAYNRTRLTPFAKRLLGLVLRFGRRW